MIPWILTILSLLPGPQMDSTSGTPAFRDLKFGIFIHFGLYSELAGEWQGEPIPERRPNAEQIDLTFKIPNKEYEKTAEIFNPSSFNATRWVAAIKKSGVKYMVITAKHQDGFSMFKTKCSSFNILEATPFRRDVIREISEACHKQGVEFGIYYSDARDFHEAGSNWNTHGNTWDFPPQTEQDFKDYFYGKVFCQVRELLTNYGRVSVMWFDVPYKLTLTMSADLRRLVHSIQPQCMINSRIGNGLGDYISLGDNTVADHTLDSAWETCITTNHTWGYSKFDHNFKSARLLLHTLVNMVSRGGNLLLNIGPDGDGQFPPKAQAVMDTLGRWLAVNREAVYGAGASPFHDPPEWRCTARPGKLFFHLFTWTGGPMRISGIQGEIKEARFLANGKTIPVKQLDGSAVFTLPREPVDPYMTVIEVKLKPKSK